MAYVHCHNCNWEQDDFWSWGYNPVRSIWGRIKDYWKPRMVRFDPPPHCYGIIFSWKVMFLEIRRVLRRIPRQKWWTWKSYKKAAVKICPSCGNTDLCID